MPTTLTLAVMASLLLPVQVQAVKQPPTAPPDSLNDPTDPVQGANLMREV